MKDLRNIDLNLLIVFNALSEEEHLTKAAAKLHLSQPAVSNALSRLRELFNDELFVRAPKGMRPTLKAQKLKAPIKQALGIIRDQLLAPEEFDCSVAKNRFSIAVNSYAESVVLPPFVKHFREIAPYVKLDIFPEGDEKTPEKLRAGELDIAIDYVHMAGKDLIHEPFYNEELVVVVSEYNIDVGARISLEEYNALPHVTIHPRNHKGSHTEILLGRKQVNRNIVMSVSSLLSFAPLVAATDMICTLPRRLAEYSCKHHPIRLLPLPFDFEHVPVHMIYSREKLDDAAHKWLRQQLRALPQFT